MGLQSEMAVNKAIGVQNLQVWVALKWGWCWGCGDGRAGASSDGTGMDGCGLGVTRLIEGGGALRAGAWGGGAGFGAGLEGGGGPVATVHNMISVPSICVRKAGEGVLGHGSLEGKPARRLASSNAFNKLARGGPPQIARTVAALFMEVKVCTSIQQFDSF